jgi:hypothetical protein
MQDAAITISGTWPAWNVTDVRLIRLSGGKVSCQYVVEHRLLVVAVGGYLKLLPVPGFNACFTHQRPRLSPTHWIAQSVQSVLHPPGAIALVATLSDLLHSLNHRLVLHIRQPFALTLAVPIIGIATDTQEPTHYVDWPGFLMPDDERIL